MRYRFNIKGMTCTHCRNRVIRALEALEGVKGVDVDLASGLARVDCSDSLDRQSLIDAVSAVGYRVEFPQKEIV